MSIPTTPPPVATVQNIGQLAAVAKESIVVSVTGTLTSIGRHITGTGQWGPYSFQDGTISDGASVFPVVFSNRDEIPKEAIGQILTFSSTSGKFGVSGLKVVERAAYKDKPKHNVLQVAKNASVVESEGDLAPSVPSETPAPTSTAATPIDPADPASTIRKNVDFVIRALAPEANLFRLCVKAVGYIEGHYMEDNDGEKMTADQRQSATACLFIEANKRGLADRLPVCDITPYLPDHTEPPRKP